LNNSRVARDVVVQEVVAAQVLQFVIGGHMARFLCAALCVVVFACLYTFPASANTCVPVADHMADAKKQPAIVDVLPLDADKLKRVIAYVKAQGAEGYDTYDTGYLAWTHDRIGLFLGNDGKICTVLVGPLHHLPRLIEAAEGRPA
jgi:hypothetical protein